MLRERRARLGAEQLHAALSPPARVSGMPTVGCAAPSEEGDRSVERSIAASCLAGESCGEPPMLRPAGGGLAVDWQLSEETDVS